MFKTHDKLSGAFSVCLLLFLILNLDSSFGQEEFGFAPIFNVERGTQSQEVDALGPFITSKKSDKTSEFGFRPLFYWTRDKEGNSSEFDFIYPFTTYRRNESDRKIRSFFYIISYESDKKESGFREKQFTLFPIVFAKSAEDKKDSYFALFPIYGRLRNKFLKDEINFYLFPLFLQTKKGETTNYSFLWPIFGYYTGEGQKGFRFWPLFGYRKKEGALDEKFALWPIYTSKERILYGEKIETLSIFPFYFGLDSPNVTQRTYIGPLFSHLVDRKRGVERWDTPWPLINFTRGKKEENRVFPFYKNEMNGEDKEGFILWPLYRYYTRTFADYTRKRDTVLFFLYSDIRDEPIVESGRRGRRIDVWPLFTYKRDRDGNRGFHFLSILEPFLSDNEGIEKNYSSFWRLYEWKKYKDGSTVSSFLWNTFRAETGKGTKKFYFLGGLFGYRSDSHKKTIKLFYFPIDVSSKNRAIGIGDGSAQNKITQGGDSAR
ncbi:MAG: hypothetical protein C4291_08855 [Candidatus Dadabacteria bacterium]